MTKRAQLADGTILEFPDETSDTVIDRTVQQHIASTRPQRPTGGFDLPTAADMVQSFASGIPQGVTGFLGQVGDVPRMIGDAAALGARLRRPELSEEQAQQTVAPLSRLLTVGARAATMPYAPAPLAVAVQNQFPTSDQLNEQVQRVTGPYYQPQTVAGQYANTAGQFASGALFPGSAAARAARVLGPAIASETAGQLTQGTPLETPARLAGGVWGGAGVEAGIRGNARAASARPLPGTLQAEQDFAPLTRGERLAVSRDNTNTTNLRELTREADLRHGTGSGRAQSILLNFDANRAELLRDNALRRTIGEPTTPDANAAGTALAEELRNQRQGLRELERGQYQRAFAGMEQESVPQAVPSVEAAARTAADAQGFDVASLPSDVTRSLRWLNGKIQGGTATQATVERARQEINRALGTARRQGDGAAAFRIERVIQAMDEWRATLPRDQSVIRLADDARAMHAEGQRLYGEQPNADLTTGHVGDTDLGGRTIERVIGTDLSGSSVLDAILGGSVKPSQQTLAAVRAIRRLQNRRFNNPGTPAGTHPPEVQALREGFMHRLLSPLDDYIRRAQTEGPARAGMLPARRLANDIDIVLNKSGREVAELLFSPQEIAELRRLQRHLQTMSPPPGSAPVSSPAMIRTAGAMVSGLLDRISFGATRIVGEAVKPLLSESVASRAVEPIGMPPRPTQPIDPRFYLGPAAGSANQRRQR